MTIDPAAAPAIATPAAAAEAISRAIAERDSKLPKAFQLDPSLPLPANVSDLRTTSGLLSPRQLEITSLDATGIRDAVAAGAYSSVEVAQAFIGAAAIAQQGTNCLVDLFHERALAQAAELDAFFAREGKTVGLLHGVPLSVKVRRRPCASLCSPRPCVSLRGARLTHPVPLTRTTLTSRVSTRRPACSPTSARPSLKQTLTACATCARPVPSSTPRRPTRSR